jgi:DNA-binding response OmpR family regulator
MAKTKKTIMLIEDEKILSDIYKLEFEQAGYNVIPVYDGKSARDIIARTFDIDLFLIDIILPKSSGFEVFLDIKNHPKYEKTPVFILSNLDLEQEMRMALKMKAEKYLIKSDYTPEKIINIVNDYLIK